MTFSFTMIKMEEKPTTQDKEEECHDRMCDLDEGSKSQLFKQHKLVEQQQRDILVIFASIRHQEEKLLFSCN